MVTEKIELHDRVSITDSVTYRARTDFADIYIKEAKRQAKIAREAFDKSLKSDGEERGDALWREKQASLFTILLSVFALEAHINRIGHDKLKDEVWEELERLRLEKKWFLFPNLIKGESFDKEGQLFKNFRNIIGLRNYLVHYKDFDFQEFVEHPCGKKNSRDL